MKALKILKHLAINAKTKEISDAIIEAIAELAELEALQSTHEAQLKQAYINGSNSTNELIQSLYKQIEQLKDNQ